MKKGLSEFEKDYFNGKTSNYKFGYDSLNNRFIWKKRIKKVLELTNKGKLLDVGCAYGYFAKFMKEYLDVVGIDISEYAIKIAKRNIGRANARRHDITRAFPFKEKFDVITAFDVIEHVPKQEKVLKNIKMVLKKDGYLLIEMPIKCNNKLITFLHNDTDPTHNHLLTYNQLISLIKKTGFRIIKEKHIIALFRGLVMIPSKKPKNFIELVLKKNS